MANNQTVILSIGSNDTGKNINTGANVQRSINAFQDKNVVVVAPSSKTGMQGAVANSVGNTPIVYIPDRYYAGGDGIHPSAAGYDYAIQQAQQYYPDTQLVGVGDSIAVGVNQRLGLQPENAANDFNSTYDGTLYAKRGIDSSAVANVSESLNGDLTASTGVKGQTSKDAAEETAANANYAQRQKDAAANPKITGNLTPEQLEKQTGLEKWEYDYIKNNFCKKNENYYFLTLVFLVYGFDYQTVQAKIDSGHNYGVLSENMLKSILAMRDEPYISSFLWKTPAYKKGSFNKEGSVGMHAVNADNALTNPITGPTKHGSAMTGGILEKMIPGANKSIEDLCTKIRTHSWLALPKGNFGSLQRIIAGINASIEAFQDMIHDIYQGAVIMIQKAYAYINGQIAKLQKQLLSFISENIIDLDLLCDILCAIQVVLDDFNFISSLFNMNGSFMTYLNSFQQYLNVGSQFISNPFSTVSQYLPSNVKNIIDTVNQIGTDPNGFLADKLNNYGQSYILNALQGNIVGAIVNKYGPQYASITPLGNVLAKAGALYTHFSPAFPAEPATMGPNIYTGYNGVKRDANGDPVGSNQRTKLENVSDAANYIFTDTFNDTSDKLKADSAKLSESLGQVGTGISDALSDLGTGINNTFTKAGDFITGKK